MGSSGRCFCANSRCAGNRACQPPVDTACSRHRVSASCQQRVSYTRQELTLLGLHLHCHLSGDLIFPRSITLHAMSGSGRWSGVSQRHVSSSMCAHLAGVTGVRLAQHGVAEARDDAAAVQRVPHKLLHLLLARRLPNLHEALNTETTWPVSRLLALTLPVLTHTLLPSSTPHDALPAATSRGVSLSA